MKVHKWDFSLEHGVDFFPPLPRHIVEVTSLLVGELILHLFCIQVKLSLNEPFQTVLQWDQGLMIVLDDQLCIEAVWGEVKLFVFTGQNCEDLDKVFITF